MNVMVIGSGAREHALAWKLAQSPRLKHLFIAPGSPGTRGLGENVEIPMIDADGLVRFALDHHVDLVVIGPEAPLADGLTNEFMRAGVRVFGPSSEAALIESSKVFSKQFMMRHNIPTARFAIFQQLEPALAYLKQAKYPLVIKASGLSAGKGVVLPNSLEEGEACLRGMISGLNYGEAGREVVIEERLDGPEVSLLAFSDGVNVKPMVPAQDHKRLLDGDMGPNTGGMGAYAPASLCSPEMVSDLTQRVLQPTVDGMRAEGRPFVGVLYVGLILTSQGAKVLEYNCRFGDPETQVILPLLKSDLLDIVEACASGRLAETPVEWRTGSAACIVLASENYPSKPVIGREIEGLNRNLADTIVFYAGTRSENGRIFSAGGRVLAVTGWGNDLPQALKKAYAAVECIHFGGMQYRKDIGWQAMKSKDERASAPSAYAASGVNIDAGNHAVQMMSEAVRSTYTPQVLAGIGSFGGLFAADFLKEFSSPVLVASTDGVGTKVKLAVETGRYQTIGQDIVNHCIDDILVQGARPLFFLDYFATSKLAPEIVAEVVGGISNACREAGCVVLGGETAEMPGVYVSGEFDLAGTIVGVVERERILPRRDFRAGDVLVGLRSSGPHTNGYSLIRKIFDGVALETVYPQLGLPLGEVLQTPHRSYFKVLWPILEKSPELLKGLAHLTGGGFIENIPRILPENLNAVVRVGSWPVPALYRLIKERGGVDELEMLRVFNMGIGMVAVVDPKQAAEFQQLVGEETWVIGELAVGERKVVLQ